MQPGPPIKVKCPHCLQTKKLSSLACGNITHVLSWSDGHTKYPMMPMNSAIQKCPHCGKYFFLREPGRLGMALYIVTEIIKFIINDFRGIEQSDDEYCFDTGHLDFDEAREAMSQLYRHSFPMRRHILRVYFLHAYNDKYGRNEEDIQGNEEDRRYFVKNCLALTKMRRTSGTLKAELFREIGDFEKCIQTLDSLSPTEPHEQNVRNMIRGRAVAGDTRVFEVENTVDK